MGNFHVLQKEISFIISCECSRKCGMHVTSVCVCMFVAATSCCGEQNPLCRLNANASWWQTNNFLEPTQFPRRSRFLVLLVVIFSFQVLSFYSSFNHFQLCRLRRTFHLFLLDSISNVVVLNPFDDSIDAQLLMLFGYFCCVRERAGAQAIGL